MQSLWGQILQTAPEEQSVNVSYVGTSQLEETRLKRICKTTLISESETPKSRLEIRSLLLPSTLLSGTVLPPLSFSSNMSCCHLSGSSLGCREQKFNVIIKVLNFTGTSMNTEVYGQPTELFFILFIVWCLGWPLKVILLHIYCVVFWKNWGWLICTMLF